MNSLGESYLEQPPLADVVQETLARKAQATPCDSDPISPQHYQMHPSGIECIEITEHMSFTLGNAVKYIWRASLKGRQIEDLKKARWYLDRELERLARESLT